KNLLKQQYRNFKGEGSETLEQTFTRLQVIIGQLQFMDVEIEHDDLNQKDSYEVPVSTTTTDTTSDTTGKKKGRTVTLTAEDMQKRKNDVKERTTLLRSLPDEHQLRFNEEESPKAAVWNFKAEGSKTLEQTFNRLQVIIGQLQFMDVEIEQDDLNQKFLTSLAPEWLMHIIKKSEPNPQNMAFISSAKHSRGNEDVNTASFSTAITNVPTASANIKVASISQDTTYAYIAS
nr:hypothetical protein [Tanacetum cinerariifolium]